MYEGCLLIDGVFHVRRVLAVRVALVAKGVLAVVEGLAPALAQTSISAHGFCDLIATIQRGAWLNI